MKICASLSKLSDMAEAIDADMIEIRLDILNNVPGTVEKNTIVTFRDAFDSSVLPKGYNGMIDIGELPIPKTSLKTISSIHDYEKTPSEKEISETLNAMVSDISKGAYAVRNFEDLKNILQASKGITKDHVLLGMGQMGEVTRIRQNILKNMFTFAYVSNSTAPGQLSLKEMRTLGDDCMLTGIVGNPLEKSKSQAMHNAAFAESGISGRYLVFPSPSLDSIEDCIKGFDIRGLNVTIPYKEKIISHLDELDEDAKKAGAVNTVVNTEGKLKGYNTDIDGIELSLRKTKCQIEGKKVLIMGSGGASRACIVAVQRNGADVSITGRNNEVVSQLASEFGLTQIPEGSSLLGFDIVINATPVGMYEGGKYPADINSLSCEQTVLDMVYGVKTQFINIATERGCKIATGEDMLAMQGARAFELWTGVDGMFEIMRSNI
ncbi:MAG TPA: shikimate dehydrogenase [Candidatus Methanomethylophilaceae archaeon]|nr:shikimate dehydrogenase [Candidatus Methanomethylophilaceae archaeon]